MLLLHHFVINMADMVQPPSFVLSPRLSSSNTYVFLFVHSAQTECWSPVLLALLPPGNLLTDNSGLADPLCLFTLLHITLVSFTNADHAPPTVF